MANVESSLMASSSRGIDSPYLPRSNSRDACVYRRSAAIEAVVTCSNGSVLRMLLSTSPLRNLACDVEKQSARLAVHPLKGAPDRCGIHDLDHRRLPEVDPQRLGHGGSQAGVAGPILEVSHDQQIALREPA